MNNDNYIQRNKQMVERILRENEQQNEIRKTMQDIKTEVNNRIKILRKKWNWNNAGNKNFSKSNKMLHGKSHQQNEWRVTEYQSTKTR